MVDQMIEYGLFLCGIHRGTFDPKHEKELLYANKGPFWASNQPIPPLHKIQEEGVVCVGLIALLFRKINIPLPFLLEYPPEIPELIFGLGGTDEWMYIYQNKLKPFNIKASYPRGTLLFRMFNEIDQGHVAMLLEDASRNQVLTTHVLHIANSLVGRDEVTVNEIVRDQHYYYVCHPQFIKPQTRLWDTTGKFTVYFNREYYTHILLPRDYLPVHFLQHNELYAESLLFQSPDPRTIPPPNLNKDGSLQ